MVLPLSSLLSVSFVTLDLHLTRSRSFLSTHTLPYDFETLVLTLSQSRQPSFRSHTLGGYDLVQIVHSHGVYDLCSLLIQIAYCLHKRLVSHLHYLGYSTIYPKTKYAINFTFLYTQQILVSNLWPKASTCKRKEW